MRPLICLSLVLLGATGALAQRGGAGGTGGGGLAGGRLRGGMPNSAGNPGMPILSPIPLVQAIPALGLGTPRPDMGGLNTFQRPVSVFPGYPYQYISGGYSPYPLLQNILVVQSAPPLRNTEPPAPPKPAQLIIWESASASSRETPVAAEQRVYVVALKDGKTISAAAVWVQDNVLHYIDSEGAHKRESLEAIDRDSTRQLNRAQNLELRLPPPR